MDVFEKQFVCDLNACKGACCIEGDAGAPLLGDEEIILNSVRKTGRLIVADGGWKFLGLPAEIIAMVTEKVFDHLKAPPCRVAFPDIPTPSSWVLSNKFYPGVINIVNAVIGLLGLPDVNEAELGLGQDIPKDIPDKSFTGPF